MPVLVSAFPDIRSFALFNAYIYNKPKVPPTLANEFHDLGTLARFILGNRDKKILVHANRVYLQNLTDDEIPLRFEYCLASDHTQRSGYIVSKGHDGSIAIAFDEDILPYHKRKEVWDKLHLQIILSGSANADIFGIVGVNREAHREYAKAALECIAEAIEAQGYGTTIRRTRDDRFVGRIKIAERA